MSSNLVQQLSLLPERLAPHLMLTLIALSGGIAVGIPVAVLALRFPRLRFPVLASAGVVQTIPGLALLALMVPLLVLLRERGRLDLPTFGFLPTVLALVLYSLLPILRNTVTGILGVDPSLIEAARGLGMTRRQRLLRVELPLAAPVILAGIRTSAVWTVGMATLSTPVGQTSLGNYIFAGLQTRNWTAVLVGCAFAAALAVALDLVLGLFESAAVRRSLARALVAGALLLGVVAACLVPWLARAQPSGPAVRVGAKTFTEQYILAELLAQTLGRAGYPAALIESLGSTVAFDALAAGDLDVYVDYSGTLWANHMKRSEVESSATVLAEVTAWLEREHGILCLGALGFENSYALAMPRKRAEALSIRTADDLAAHAPAMRIGGDYELFSRPEWKRLEATYGLRFREQVSYDSSFMYRAAHGGEVDVIAAFSSDGRIAAYDLAVLEDPRRAFPPYDALLLIGPGARARWPRLADALSPLIGAIGVAKMRAANMKVDSEGLPRADAARWLAGEVGRGD